MSNIDHNIKKVTKTEYLSSCINNALQEIEDNPEKYNRSNKINAASLKASLHDALETINKQHDEEERAQIEKQNAPLIKQFQAIIAETQEQNRILAEQIKLQKEESERQKQEIERASRSERRANIRTWISIAVAIISVVATIVIAIVK